MFSVSFLYCLFHHTPDRKISQIQASLNYLTPSHNIHELHLGTVILLKLFRYLIQVSFQGLEVNVQGNLFLYIKYYDQTDV